MRIALIGAVLALLLGACESPPPAKAPAVTPSHQTEPTQVCRKVKKHRYRTRKARRHHRRHIER